jgi:hypothetical protein
VLVSLHPDDRDHLAAVLRAVREAPPNSPPALAHLRARKYPHAACAEWIWAEYKLLSDVRSSQAASPQVALALGSARWAAAV